MIRRRFDSDEEQREIVPVAVTLRNAFAPRLHMQSTGKQHETHINDHLNTDKCDDDNADNDDDDDDDDDDIGEADICQTQSYVSAGRLPAGGIHEASMIPIEMEIVVPYSLVVRLKQSYKTSKAMKRRISQFFGLENNEKERKMKNDGHDGNDDGNDDRLLVLCSKVQGCKTSHLLWDHLDERLDDLYREMISVPPSEEVECGDKAVRDEIWTDILSAMRIQCKAIMPSTTTHSIEDDDDDNDDDDDGSSSDGEMSPEPFVHTPKASNQSRSIMLASAPLNPKQLKKLPFNSTGTEASGILAVSKYNNSIPHSLPRNSPLMHYSDGTTRVHPNLYEILIKQEVIAEPVLDGSSYDDVEVDKFEKRFADDMFSVLGDASSNRDFTRVKLKLGSPVKIPDRHEHGVYHESKQNGSHYFEAKRLITNGGDSLKGHANGVSRKSNGERVVRGSFAEAFDSLAIHSRGQKSNGDVLMSSMDLGDDDSESDDDSTGRNDVELANLPHSDAVSRTHGDIGIDDDSANESCTSRKRDDCEIISRIQDTDGEMERLQQVLDAEEEALNDEERAQDMVSNFVPQ